MSNRNNQSKQSRKNSRKAGQRQRQLQQQNLPRKFIGPLPKTIRAPAAQSRQYVTNAPSIRQTSAKSCRIVHRELVDTVTFPVIDPAFAPRKFPLNAGDDETFSWLSNIAVNWERYKFHRLSFHYLTRSSSNTAGSVMLACDYDAADIAPIDEQTIMSYESAREDVVWKDVVIHCKPNSFMGGRRDHFVRSGALAANLDIKMYDIGNLWVAFDRLGTSDLPAGKLFVEYDVEFFTPQLPPTGDPQVGSTQSVGGGAMTNIVPFGTAPTNAAANTLGNMIYNAAANVSQVILPDDIAAGTMEVELKGTGLSGITLPTLSDFSGNPSAGTVQTLVNFLTNGAATVANQTFLIKGAQARDILTFPSVGSASLTGATMQLNRVLPGVFG